MKVRYRERALADLEDIFQFLNNRSPAGAHNVLRAIREAIVRMHRIRLRRRGHPKPISA